MSLKEKWAALSFNKKTGVVLVGVAIVGAVYAISINAERDEQSDRPPEEAMPGLRRDFAQELEDTLRNKGAGVATAITTEDSDARVLVIKTPGCDARWLEDLVAAPAVQEKLRDYNFWKVRCDNVFKEKVAAPWRRR